jgi:hypothetical protein
VPRHMKPLLYCVGLPYCFKGRVRLHTQIVSVFLTSD